jgi:5'(3')-deoxyribonucleotidase
MSKKTTNSCGELLPETKKQIMKEIVKRINIFDECMMDEVSLNSWSITSSKINLSFSITLRDDRCLKP